MRYLGVYLKTGRRLKCNFSTAARRAFSRAVNAIVGKLGIDYNCDVLLHLIRVKCMPILMYGLKVCTPDNASLHSIDFVTTRFLMKIFKSKNVTFVLECAMEFGLQLPSALLPIRRRRFFAKAMATRASGCFADYFVCIDV